MPYLKNLGGNISRGMYCDP